jgi:hypothetical protein
MSEEGDWRLLHPQLRSAAHIQAVAARNIELREPGQRPMLSTGSRDYAPDDQQLHNPNWNNITLPNTQRLTINILNSNIKLDIHTTQLYHINKDNIVNRKTLPKNFWYVLVKGERYSAFPIEQLNVSYYTYTSSN